MPPKGSQAVTKKPRSGTKAAAAAAGTRSTTPFLDALMVVPDLALTCSSILDSDRHALGPGSGLKRLRLLSQGFKAAIHKAVHGFKLELNFKEPVASAIDYPRMLAFLKGVQLLRLRIIVLPLGRGKADHASMIPASAKLAAHLCAFITSAGPALQGVNHLTISMPPTTGSKDKRIAATTSTNALLLPLAAACPQLQTLTVTGTIQPSFLKHFGSKCPKLACMELAMTDMETQDLMTLPQLLPHLTSLTSLTSPFTPPNSISAQCAAKKRIIKRICITLRACPGLLAFNSGLIEIQGDIWGALPARLTSLTCRTSEYWPQMGVLPACASLRTLAMLGEVNDLAPIIAVLAAAPNVSVLRMRQPWDMLTVLTREDAQALQHFQTRLDAGLVLTEFEESPHNAGLRKQHRVRIVFTLLPEAKRKAWDATTNTYQHPMHKFLSCSFMDKPLPSFTDVEFNMRKECVGERGQLSDLPRVFPNIRELTVINLLVEDIEALANCTSLHTLTLTNVNSISRSELEGLCKASKALRNVHMEGCGGLSVEDENWIAQSGGKLAGVSVVVKRGQRLEKEGFATGQEQKEERRWVRR